MKRNAEPVKDAMEEEVDEIFARVAGGMISASAVTRSSIVSEARISWSEATDISESIGFYRIVSKRRFRILGDANFKEDKRRYSKSKMIWSRGTISPLHDFVVAQTPQVLHKGNSIFHTCICIVIVVIAS